MKKFLMKEVVRAMRAAADKIDAGNCELTEEEAMEIMSVLSHQALSKDEACVYTGYKRSRFDDMVRIGIFPKGKKRKGRKELLWYKDELDEAIREYNNKYTVNR